MDRIKIKKNKALLTNIILLCAAVLLFVISLLVGKFDLSFKELINSNELHKNVFLTLRLPRTAACVISGIVLSSAGYAYQTVFKILWLRLI